MDKIKALNTKVMAKDFGRVGLGTLAIAAGAFLWGKFLYGRGVRGCQRWMCETFPDEYESMTEKVADMLEQQRQQPGGHPGKGPQGCKARLEGRNSYLRHTGAGFRRRGCIYDMGEAAREAGQRTCGPDRSERVAHRRRLRLAQR